jgi:hypothetical protein
VARRVEVKKLQGELTLKFFHSSSLEVKERSQRRRARVQSRDANAADPQKHVSKPRRVPLTSGSDAVLGVYTMAI